MSISRLGMSIFSLLQNAHSAVQMRCGRISFFRGEFQQNVRIGSKVCCNMKLRNTIVIAELALQRNIDFSSELW